MDAALKSRFLQLWRKYFNNAELPLAFYYSQQAPEDGPVKPGAVARCVIAALAEVRKGHSLTFDVNSVGCFGGRKYLGFADNIRPDFEYFLSCGIPGKMEGERYKKSPELVKALMKNWPDFKAPEPFVIFKRWDMLEPEDNPEVAIFFARPDTLAGLFTLANYDRSRPEAVFTPMGSGCSSIVSYPYMERDSAEPRAVIGMFDPSARPHVPEDALSFALPFNMLAAMMENMDESFLITKTWKVLQKRMGDQA